MGIFDFLKRKKKELEEQEQEKISFNDISNWIDEKKNKIKDEQNPALKQIKDNLYELLSSLEQRVEVLENLDLAEKKAPERAMSIVRENFDKFVYELEKLIINLKDIGKKDEDLDLQALINKINSIFEEFEKKSIMAYKKSTFLIGDELGAVTQDIAKFFKLFNKTIKENESSINQSKIISIVEKKLKEINKLNQTKQENNKSIDEIDEKVETFEQKIGDLKKQVEEKKQTQEYIDQVSGKNKLESNKTKLIIEYQGLKELIDFKALAKVYHKIENKMALVKEYKENFKEALEKHGGQNFIDLVDIEDIDKKVVENKINIINEIGMEISGIEHNLGEDVLLELERKIKIISEKIGEMNVDKIKLERVMKNLSEEVNKIRVEVVEELEKIRVVVEKSSDII